MPPRYQSTVLTFEEKARNLFDHFGQPAHRGHARVGPGLQVGGQGQSLIQNPGAGETAASGQLLVLSATGDSIASGGDYVSFDAEVYRHGFDGFYVDAETVAWPVTFAGAEIQVELAWDSFESGGKIEIEVDGAVPAWGLLADESSGQKGSKRRSVHINAGAQVKIKVTQSSGSAQTGDFWVEFACPDPADSSPLLVEEVWLDSRVGTVTTSTVLSSGRTYRLDVVGNYRDHDAVSLIYGTTDTILWPSPSFSADAAEYDVDTQFAGATTGTYPRHITDVAESRVTFDLGSGAGHLEPDGGPFSAPEPGHAYTFTVVGQDSAVTIAMPLVPRTDNNGMLRIRVNAL